MATEDPATSYTMVEDDDSVHTDLAERISQFNWDPDTGSAVTALFPAHWTGNTGDLVTLREDGSVVLDMDDTFGLPEPFDRVAPPTMITTTTGMAVLKADHPANQTIESGFRSLNIPVPDVIQALGAREAALAGDGSTIHSFRSEVLGMWSGWNEPVSTALLGDWADTLYDQGRLTPDALSKLKSRPASSTGSSLRSGAARSTMRGCCCSTPRSATGCPCTTWSPDRPPPTSESRPASTTRA